MIEKSSIIDKHDEQYICGKCNFLIAYYGFSFGYCKLKFCKHFYYYDISQNNWCIVCSTSAFGMQDEFTHNCLERLQVKCKFYKYWCDKILLYSSTFLHEYSCLFDPEKL